MKENRYNIMIVGVGGQGVLLASEILSEAALAVGFDVKKSEIHGMSQRGGVVTSHIKIAPKVYSPTIPDGQADVLLSFEQAEGLRSLHCLKPEGIAIVSNTTLIPAIVTSSKEYNYPLNAIDLMREQFPKVIGVEADKIAQSLGNPRLVNTILLGVLSNHMFFDKGIWLETLKKKVKAKFVDINIEAFNKGREITFTQTDESTKQHV